MPRFLVIIAFSLTAVLAAMLTGCATVQDMNPFTTRPLNASEVVYSQFSNIPVPKEMSPVPRRSFTNYTPEGVKNGMETLEANVDQTELTRAMVSNMVRDGWALRMALSGQNRCVQVYEQQNSYAVIYYYHQTTTTAMEIWVGSRLADGAWQQPALGGGAVDGGYNPSPAGSGYTPPSAPPSQPSGSGVKERALP